MRYEDISDKMAEILSKVTIDRSKEPQFNRRAKELIVEVADFAESRGMPAETDKTPKAVFKELYTRIYEATEDYERDDAALQLMPQLRYALAREARI